jgi:GNAT superfamily N-acetyltransferase
MDSPLQLVYRPAALNEIIQLRHAVLCAGKPFAEAHFQGDDHSQTHHFGAFLPAGDGGAPEPSAAVGCVSYMMTKYEGQEAWQLRGMATRPDFAQRGVGRRLVAAAEQVLLQRHPVRLFWCKARVPAIGFYEKLGWRVVSDEFVIEGYGPHRLMMIRR